MKLFLISFLLVFMLISVDKAYSDQVFIDEEGQKLILSIRRLEIAKDFEANADDLKKIEQAICSKLDNVSISALRVILAHRMVGFWMDHKACLNFKKGTSGKLGLIIEDIFRKKISELHNPLIDLYSKELLKLLPKASSSIPPNRPINGDAPIDVVLIEIALIDSVSIYKEEVRYKSESEANITSGLKKISNYYLTERQNYMHEKREHFLNKSVYYY